jgi:hypothetical protein
MFIAHFGVGLGAKKFAPKVSLGMLFIAAQFLDLLWPTLLLLNIEHVAIHPELENSKQLAFIDYPISHSLLLSIAWSVIFGGLFWIIRKDLRAAVVLGICVLSHWILDLIVHFHDLPLYPGNSPLVGFGLWGSTIATQFTEGAIFITGMVVYLRATAAKNNIGRIVFWILMALLVVSHVSSLFAPPPASVTALAWYAQMQWLFVLLAFWADKNRKPRLSE